MFRLHIDIPLNTDEQTAANLSNMVIGFLSGKASEHLVAAGVEEINYRLGNDDDRQKSNYLIKTESGHVANKKTRVPLKEEST
jgi:hypothetical protein